MTNAPCILPATGLGPIWWVVGGLMVMAGFLISRLPRRHRLRAMIVIVLPLSFMVSRPKPIHAASTRCGNTTTVAPTTTTLAATTSTVMVAPTTATTVVPTTTTTVAPTTTTTVAPTTTTIPTFSVTVLTSYSLQSVTSITGTAYTGDSSHAALSGSGTLTSGRAPAGTVLTIQGAYYGLSGVVGGTCGIPETTTTSPVVSTVDCTTSGNFSVTLEWAD